MRLLDLKGKSFGRWLVLERAENQGRFVMWLCRCNCGNEKKVSSGNLVSAKSTSCGCLSREKSRKHGASGTASYNSWNSMMHRCYSPNASYFERYGGAGIKVCERWHDFENFLADMGERPSAAHTIDRIDGLKNYSPDNCRWATKKEQAENRRSSIFINCDGDSVCIAEAARRAGISACSVSYRVRVKGLSHQAAFDETVSFKAAGA